MHAASAPAKAEGVAGAWAGALRKAWPRGAGWVKQQAVTVRFDAKIEAWSTSFRLISC